MASSRSVKTGDGEWNPSPVSDSAIPATPGTVAGFSLVPLAILCVTFIAYIDTVLLGFVFDDHILIVTNDSIRSWRYFPSYFTSHIWAFRYPHLLANYYRPLFLTWLRVNDMLFGLHPRGWHVTSMFAHLAVTYLVYRLAFRLTQDGWVAAVAGFLFGLHPVHAEAVADITSIQEPLSTLFILAAVLAFARGLELKERNGPGLAAESRAPRHSTIGWTAAALIFTAAALLTKENGLLVPVLIFAWTWIYGLAGGGEAGAATKSLFAKFKSALMATIPFWLVVFAYIPARIHALKGFAHMVTPLPYSTLIRTIPSVLTFYLRLLVWPAGLSCYYDTPSVQTLDAATFFVPVLVLVMLVGGALFWHARLKAKSPREASALAFTALWTAVTILPVLNFRFLPEGEIAHDRYVYLPSVGFLILVALAMRRLRGHFRQGSDASGAGEANQIAHPPAAMRGTEGSEISQAIPSIIISIMLILCGIMTLRQNLFWADDLTLNYRAHQIAPNNIYATTSLGAAVAARGMTGQAMELYRQALERQPNFWRANVNLGNMEYAEGDYRDAAQHLATACAVDPADGDQFLYLGMSLLRMGRFTEAESAVRTALEVRPGGKNYHLGLGMVLRGEKRFTEAKQEILTELSADPQNAQALNLLDQVNLDIEKAGAAK
jgi:Flp pilus assembly protein TadD